MGNAGGRPAGRRPVSVVDTAPAEPTGRCGMGNNVERQALRFAFFETIDENSDGSVTVAELIRVVERLREEDRIAEAAAAYYGAASLIGADDAATASGGFE